MIMVAPFGAALIMSNVNRPSGRPSGRPPVEPPSLVEVLIVILAVCIVMGAAMLVIVW